MAIVQQSKLKAPPVVDYRDINPYIEAYLHIYLRRSCKLWEWRQKGSNVLLLDLRKAYLQVRVDETLWSFQTVAFRGKRYCLTRLGFALNDAPQIIKTIFGAVLSQDEMVEKVTSAYLEDIYINEDISHASGTSRHQEDA